MKKYLLGLGRTFGIILLFNVLYEILPLSIPTMVGLALAYAYSGIDFHVDKYHEGGRG